MTTDVPTGPRPLSMTEAVIPIVALVVLVGLSYFLFGDAGAKGPNQVALVLAAMIALVIGRRAGYTNDQLRDAAIASVGTGISAIFILFAVGALTGAWAMSGTLMAMVYYGLQILSPNYFYMTTALICGLVAFSIGSSWTVAATKEDVFNADFGIRGIPFIAILDQDGKVVKAGLHPESEDEIRKTIDELLAKGAK